MKKLALLVFVFVQFAIYSQIKPEIHHRARIFYNSLENFNKLEQLGVPMDHGIHKKGYWLTSDFSESELELAKKLGCKVTIEINDVSKFYVDQNKSTSKNSQNTNCTTTTKTYATPENFNLGSMGGYLTYAQMLQELDDMRGLFPNLIATRSNVGTFLTSENRAIQWTKITNNVAVPNTKPQALFTAIHHAREPASMMQTIFFMWYLLENYETNPEVKNIVDNTELYFIPVINADGYVYNETIAPNGGGMWRKNRRIFGGGNFGVDNNRNYDYWINGNPAQSIWNTLGVSASSNGQTYPGTSAFSEPENKAIKFFVESHNFKIAMNAHTFSNLLLYPYGYDLNVPSPDDAIFAKLSKLLVSENNYTNQIASDLYAASGDSDDWMYGQTFNHQKILAFTPEIGSSFWPASTDIIPLCNQMMLNNLTTAKLLLDFAVVKDTSPNYLGATPTVQAGFELTRLGLSGAGNFTVTANPISSNITSVGQPYTITNMAAFSSANAFIELGLANGTASGDEIKYELVVDNGTFQERVVITKKFGSLQTLTIDNGSSILPTWTTTASDWLTTTESFNSPSTSITDSPNALYLANQNKTIKLTNPINLSNINSPQASFYSKWDLENNFDYVQFQISTNGGTSWISQCGKYTNAGSTDSNQPNEPVYDGKQLNWIKETIDLSDYIGQTIQVRFLLKTDGFEQLDGFYFDDFEVKSLVNSVLKTNNVTVSQFGIYPNPANSFLKINTSNEDYSIEIYNSQSQLVFKKENNEGANEISISDLASGIYFIKLKADSSSEIKKMVKK